ncbi:MAG TPA: glycosyltransferase [Candidatus Nitrosopolaris sp.]|nr:glycosyltransferase [Candidatus Nitrosopolaris sp.]
MKLGTNFWIGFFFTILFLWVVSILNIVYFAVNGIQPLIDKSIDLYSVTLPMLIVVLSYLFLGFFVFIVYMVSFGRVKNNQIEAIKNADNIDNIGVLTRSSLAILGKVQEKDLCSIIIAARDEDSVIRTTVNGCLKQSYGNIEVIVVCHNCSDKTYEEAKKISDNRVCALDYQTKADGKGIALNYGVEQSRGKYILILDADGLLTDDFIEKGLPLFGRDTKYAAIQGRYLPSNRDYSFVSKMLAIEGDLWSTPYMTARTFLDKRCGLGGTGYIIRRDVLIEVGGFSNHLVDDYELTCRLFKKKYRIVFAPLCINYDEKPPDLTIMLGQRARWAKGFLDMLRHRAAEPTDILGTLLWLSPFAVYSGFVLITLVAVATLYNLAFKYYPFYYASTSIYLWIFVTLLLYALQAMTLVKQYGRKGVRLAVYVPIYDAFIIYVLVTFIRAFTVKSWGSTKTAHGFIKSKK